MSEALTEERIRQCLKESYRPGEIALADGDPGLAEPGALKCAAVLVPLAWWKREWQLIFTRRTETVEQHKGQVSFPGGGCEVHESSPEATALREAWEEIGLKPEDVHLLGRLTDLITITGYRVTPVVGIIPWPLEIRLEPAEVGRVFSIPLPWLGERANWVEQHFNPEGFQRSFQVIRYRPYDGEILWGITARIVLNFLKVLGV